jgi:hypothetical protein
MRDGPLRGALKRRLATGYLRHARAQRTHDRVPWVLRGSCGGCASCCEAPGIAVGALVYFLPGLRQLFLWWQRVVNGFVFVRGVRSARAFVFRCTHFDVVTRRCDSYDTRPGMCRDYPRRLLSLPDPELFARCGYRVVARNGPQLLASLRDAGVEGERLVQISRRLRLE